MGKYLKMADVFDGKVAEGLTVNGPSIHGKNHAFYANTKDRRVAVYASRAINSHDELVAEVERLRNMVRDLQLENEGLIYQLREEC